VGVGDHAVRFAHSGRASRVDADASAHDTSDNHASDDHASHDHASDPSGHSGDQLDQPDPVVDEQRP
jgi:hypothetical protein